MAHEVHESTRKYFENFAEQIDNVYCVAEEARRKGYDPADKVEIPLATSLAEKVVGLIATLYPQMNGTGISKRILELEEKYGKLDPAVSVQIAEEVARQNFCNFDSLIQSIDAGVRIGFAYITLGVVSSPIEGLTEIKIKQTRDGKEYLSPYYSGPVRSAGGTGAAFSLVITDYLRQIFGFAKYDPTEDEIKRIYTELTDYHEKVTNLQYMPTEEEARLIASRLPIQVNGEASEKKEVSNYKNLERVETNYIRSGFCLALGEGLAQKAAKIKRYIKSLQDKGFKLEDWDFLEDYITLHEQRDKGKTDDSPTYINDLVAGRPVFGHPSRSGAFRFRYGRGRVSGFSAASLHSATMAVTDSFIATGTQLKIEKPTKGCAVTVCDLIEGPIVKLKDGTVKQLKSNSEAKKIYPEIDEIIYLGDILFPYSDLANRNYTLIKPGYVEEWWGLELREKNPELEKQIDCYDVSFEKAVEISKENGVSFYPRYIYYWTEIDNEENPKELLIGLTEWMRQGKIAANKLVLPYGKSELEKFAFGKRALEILGVEHEVFADNVVVNEVNTKSILLNLGVDYNLNDVFLKEHINPDKFMDEKPTLEIINSVSDFEIRDKAGDFIGSRMGRPEKAKLRKLAGSPNILFPVGNEGGRLRSVNVAYETGSVKSAFPIFYCENCKSETIYRVCERCDKKTRKRYFCFECKEKSLEKCSEHGRSVSYSNQSIDMKHYFNKAVEKLGMKRTDIPPLIKGVRGTSSADHNMEHLSKGILRAKYGLQVNKDGTIRFDATELPVTSFKPKEVYVSVEKLRELGYTKDIFGNELENEEQIIELKPHDVILPSSVEASDERADEVFVKTSKFVDEELTRFYEMKPFYNLEKKEDLVGHLGVCMAPHNCAGVICRIIGFSNTQGLLASPYMHAAIRRDCDGDEAAVMLLMDVLLNFSLEFLPKHRGGTQDAPLVLNGKIDAGEVDDQIMDFEFVKEYPLELYKLAEQRKHSSEIKIPTVKSILKEGKDPFYDIGFTHDTPNFNYGIVCSSYKFLGTMQEKVEHQMNLVEKLRGVDTSDTARLIIEKHFIKDMRGNLRGFSMQTFRCVECNEILRRPPLDGKCKVCKGKLIFTVNEGGIKKYLDPALDLVEKYHLSVYMKQNLEMIKRHLDSVFGKELEKQEALAKWF